MLQTPIPSPTASKIKSTLNRAGVQPFKVKRQRSGVYLVEFRKGDADLDSAEKLARDVLVGVGDSAALVAKHEWFRDYLPGKPRSIVLIEFRLTQKTAVA